MSHSDWIPPDGLDSEFLQFIGTTRQGIEAVQSFYVPMFLGDQFARGGPIVDLGCGEGAFVGLLSAAGRECLGVDSDSTAIKAGLARDLNLLQGDCLAWLREQPESSLGGVFAAHLVEHLPYEATLELIEQSYRVLTPQGLLVLATPDPRALVSHLDMFWMHFGHHAMYHPSLLAFFMKHAGFENISIGSNPQTDGWWQGMAAAPPPEADPPGGLKGWLRHWLGIDPRAGQERQVEFHNVLVLNRLIARLDQPFEGYAMGVKPSPDSTPTPA